MFRGSVKSTGYSLHSPVSPSLPLPCVTVCHHISAGLCSPHYPLLDEADTGLLRPDPWLMMTLFGCSYQGLWCEHGKGQVLVTRNMHSGVLAYYAWPRTLSTKVTRKEKKSVTSARSPRNTSAQLRNMAQTIVSRQKHNMLSLLHAACLKLLFSSLFFFWVIPGIWIVYADVSEHSVCFIFIGGVHSDAGEFPQRKEYKIGSVRIM